MTMREFIKTNRDELDDAIKLLGSYRFIVPNARLNDNERENWIMNDEGLYEWARIEGVRI